VRVSKTRLFSGTLKGVNLIVGQNIKFDLLYLWKDNPRVHTEIYELDIQIWDTQLAEYLLTGQDTKWAKLDDLATKYGGTVKDSRIKEYWDAGVDTEDIPNSEIVPYLKGDVINTDIIFLKQLTQAHKMGMLPLIMSQMEALLATAEMEFAGMEFDWGLSMKKAEEAMDKSGAHRDLLVHYMENAGMMHPNPSSNQQIGTYLFGGSQKYREKVDMIDDDGNKIRFKSGIKKNMVRTKLVDREKEIPRVIKPRKEWANKEGYAVNNDILTELERAFKGSTDEVGLHVLKFIDLLQSYRALEKDAKTYYIGFANMVWPGGKIHVHFNHATTNTGRLSSSAPNLQNVTTQEKE
jgi:DNA polymerase I-like protein with 3'-5' exonuclease and polymerase domains